MNYNEYKELEQLKKDATKNYKDSVLYKAYEDIQKKFKIAENWKKEQLEHVNLGGDNHFDGEDFKVTMTVKEERVFSLEKLKNDFPAIYDECFIDTVVVKKQLRGKND